MQIRAADMADLPQVCQIMEEARASLGALGIDQWQNGHPNQATLQNDIASGAGYVAVFEGRIAGYCFLSAEGEPTYQMISAGQWGSHTPYLTIHRVMVSSDARRLGTASALLRFAEEQACALGIHALRIDTHQGNVPMQRMIAKAGFIHRGTIFLQDGAPRLAYDKQI